MEDEIQNTQDLSEDLNTLQQLMIESTLSIKKQLSSTVLPIVSAIAVFSIIVLGLLINVGNLIINIIVVLALVLLASFVFLFRHFFYARSVNNVIEHLSTGEPLKDGKSLPYIDKYFTFLSPKEIYSTAKEPLEEEWFYLFPLFEEELDKIDESKAELQ